MSIPAFVDYSPATPITASFLNPVSSAVFGALADGSNNPPTTAAQVLTNLGLSNSTGLGGAALIGFDGSNLGQQFLSKVNRVVDSISALAALNPATYTRAFAVGYYADGDGGGGCYYYSSGTSQALANGGTIIASTYVGATGCWLLAQTGWATFLQFGAKGDGTTDDSTHIQACIDAMKGGLVIGDAGKTFLCAGITLNGTTYNNTTIRVDGWLLLKPDAGGSTFGGAWVGILFEQCDGVQFSAHINGNRTNMTATREQIFCVGVAGATNLKFPFLEIKEIQGDGVYIGQSNWQASSTNPSHIEFGFIKGYNSADAGRNLISIISGLNIHIKRAESVSIGGTINGVVEPGGIDIEPDFGYETCYNIRIDSLDVITAGTSGFSVLGKSVSGNDANLDWNTSLIEVTELRILRTGTTGSGLAGSGFTRCADLTIQDGFYQYNSTPGAGPVHDFSQRVKANWRVNNVTYGCWLAPGGFIYQGDFFIKADSYTQSGVICTGLTQTRVKGRGFGSVATNTTYGIHCTNNARSITQTEVSYEFDAPYDNVMAAAFYNDATNPVTYGAGCIARDCDWSGYASYAATCNALIPLQDVIGMTWASSIPTNGTWHWQTFVRNSQVVVNQPSAGKIIFGWARLNSGSNNVGGSDWTGVVCTTS